MASTAARRPRRPRPAKAAPELRGTCPVYGRPLRPVPTVPPEALPSLVERVRLAQGAWGQRSFDDRLAALRRAARRMLERRAEVIELVRLEIGKLEVDALMSEALGPLEQLMGSAEVVRRAIAPRKVRLNPVSFPRKRASYRLVPRGVVGIIAPWNYPLSGVLRSLYPALLTGNGVVLKPSEYAPRTGAWLVEQLAAELPEDLVTVAQGAGDVGAALVESGIDACVFTGSVRSGMEVQRRCAEVGIPVSAEMGGNDPAIVLGDCDLDRTVAGLTHWTLHNTGQACGAVEVALVDARVADLLVDRLRRAWSRLRVGPGPFAEVDISPLANQAQLDRVEQHVADALAKGARLVCGGRATGQGLFYEPTLLDGCTEEMEVVREETFGPVLAVVRVGGAEEAVAIANRIPYGLTASLWTTDLHRAERLAERLDYGVVTVNNHSLTGAIAALPWSGQRRTGHSVANSELALATFTRPKALLVDRARDPEPFWMPFDGDLWRMGEALADAQIARIERALQLPAILRRRKRTIQRFFR